MWMVSGRLSFLHFICPSLNSCGVDNTCKFLSLSPACVSRSQQHHSKYHRLKSIRPVIDELASVRTRRKQSCPTYSIMSPTLFRIRNTRLWSDPPLELLLLPCPPCLISCAGITQERGGEGITPFLAPVLAGLGWLVLGLLLRTLLGIPSRSPQPRKLQTVWNKKKKKPHQKNNPLSSPQWFLFR